MELRKKDEVIYKYRLCRKNGVWQTKRYNSFIGGASLEGEVLAVEGEKLKLHLNIDKNQNKDEAAWFPYAPPTGNAMYSMPIVGTSARLYFPNESSEAPIVTGCVRTNGSSCAKTSDTTKRYFGTEHGSEIEMTPGALNIKGGSKEPLSISFDDNVGVTIKSPKKLSLNADDEIIIKTPQSVKLKAQSQILVAKTGTQSGLSMETDIHFLSNNVIKNGSDREAYPPFEDEPEVGTKPDPPEPPKEEKKGFNWGKLALGVVAAVAVVAMVALSVVTFGAGAVAGAAVIGFCLGAVCGIGKTAISDKNNGKMSSLGTYAKNAFKDGFIFAITSAIFPPLSGVKVTGALGEQVAINLSGKQMLGCVFGDGMLSNYLTQLWDNGEIDVGETIKSGLESMAFLGLLHGAGKLFKKASPFVKKAAGKIASEISSGAKSTLNKAVGGLDNMLNGINRKLDKFVYDMNKSLNLQPKLAGGVDVYIPPEESTLFKDKMSKITGESGTKGVGEATNGDVESNKFEVKDGKRNTRSENSLERKLKNRTDEHGNRVYSDDEIKAIMDIRNSAYELTLENGEKITIKRHGYQKNDASGQSHHLNQDAAYRDVIPREEGLAIDAEGNVFIDKDSSHYKAHETIEKFWDKFRVGGEMQGKEPTVGEYNSALKDSMKKSGFSEADADIIVEIAANQQRAYGLTETSKVPRIPGKINAVER